MVHELGDLTAPARPARCRVCDSTRLQAFLDLGRQPLCNNFLLPEQLAQGEPTYPLVLHLCEDCSLVQLTEAVPTPDMFSDHTYLSGTTAALAAHFARLAESLQERYLHPGDLVVDIGSNDGTFLKGYRRPEIRVLGVEACDGVAEVARRAGIPTCTAFLDETTAAHVRDSHGPARLVTAAGVWFHLDDLHSATRAVRSLLAPDGVFVIQAMYLGDVLANDAYDSFYHEHLCLYSLAPLRTLLARHELDVVDVEHSPIHGGSLTVTCMHQGAAPVAPSVGECLAAEEARGLRRLETYRAFADRTRAKSARLRTMLEDSRAQGRRVWAYGAPAKSATLLNFAGIGPELIEQALEVNPLKCGRLTPGTHIPVVDENALGDERADDIVSLSWNFQQSLESRIRGWLRPGGRILLPVPEPHWV